MTEDSKKLNQVIREKPEDILKAIVTDEETFLELENIAVQAQLYHGISPFLCSDYSAFSIEMLEKLQKHCLLLYLDKPTELYLDIADKICLLLNNQISFEKVLTLSFQDLEEQVDNILKIKYNQK